MHRILLLLFIICSSYFTQAQLTVANPDTTANCVRDTIFYNILSNDIGDDLELSDILNPPASGTFMYNAAGFIYYIPDEGDFAESYTVFYEVCGDDDDDDDACAIGEYTIFLNAYEDCVWPGDANADGISNHFDLLNIGIFYNSFGPNRFDTDGFWEATYCENWDPGTFIGALNPKFADTNGDGFINAADSVAIQNNYGLLHALKTSDLSVEDATPLMLVFPDDTFTAGSTVVAQIILGSELLPAEDIYGLGFTIEYDASLAISDSTKVSFASGWLGTEGSDVISLRKTVSPGVMDVSVTRIDQAAVSGSGQIGTVSFVMEGNLAGKSDLIMTAPFTACINPVYRAVNPLGSEKVLSTLCDTLILTYELTVQDMINLARDIVIYPNPGTDYVEVDFPPA
ncbi:MAG: hypothetical protein ACK4IY_05015, partial [Chitinophagales bacterium]